MNNSSQQQDQYFRSRSAYAPLLVNDSMSITYDGTDRDRKRVVSSCSSFAFYNGFKIHARETSQNTILVSKSENNKVSSVATTYTKHDNVQTTKLKTGDIMKFTGTVRSAEDSIFFKDHTDKLTKSHDGFFVSINDYSEQAVRRHVYRINSENRSSFSRPTLYSVSKLSKDGFLVHRR